MADVNESILHRFYMGEVNELERTCEKPLAGDREMQLYEELKKELTGEQFGKLNDFINLYGSRYDGLLEDKYLQGFKTGLLMGIEASKLKL